MRQLRGEQMFSVFVLSVWGGMFVFLFVSGRVKAYLHPAFQLLSGITGGILLFLGVALVVERWLFGQIVDRPHTHQARGWPMWGVRVLLLCGFPLLAIWVSPEEFSMGTLQNRGLVHRKDIRSLPVAAVPRAAFTQQAGGEEEDYFTRNETGQIVAEVLDLVVAAEEPALREAFGNKEVEVIGQYVPEVTDSQMDGTDERFRLLRLTILCCAADAQPLAVDVQTEQMGNQIREMAWVKVVGSVTFPIGKDGIAPLIQARSIQPVDPPEERFIY